MQPRVTKIVVKDGDYVMHWEEENETTKEVDRFTLETCEGAKPNFLSAWAEMKDHFRRMCELGSKELERLTVTTVKINKIDETISVSIEGVMSLKGAKAGINIKTPMYSYDTASEGSTKADKKNQMSQECYEDLIDLESKALLFIEGDRQQLSLFDAGPSQEVEQMETAVI